MSYHRKQWEKRDKARKQGKRLPRSVYELGVLPLSAMPGSEVRRIVERTEKSARDARSIDEEGDYRDAA